MKTKMIMLLLTGLVMAAAIQLALDNDNYHAEFRTPSPSPGLTTAHAYPPAVGILSGSKNCMSCHVNNGPWNDDGKLIVDILDADTKRSVKQPDGSFVIETERWEQKKLLTVIGWLKEKTAPPPARNAWLYIDPSTIGTSSLSKFAPNWDVNLPLSCRLVGDQLPGYENANITSLPMIIQPMSNAQHAELQLQIMLTKGESAKGNAKEGMTSNYFERKVFLKVK
ncbi:MAG: hypothetical protein ACOYXT_08440 [Bacteroidota bacterium]